MIRTRMWPHRMKLFGSLLSSVRWLSAISIGWHGPFSPPAIHPPSTNIYIAKCINMDFAIQGLKYFRKKNEKIIAAGPLRIATLWGESLPVKAFSERISVVRVRIWRSGMH